MEKKENSTTSRFQFAGYLIDQCSFSLTGQPVGDEMEFGIDPSGDFDAEEKRFKLTMAVTVNDKGHNLDVRLRIHGFFTFETGDTKELRTFIGINAPALLFPYLRAYITNITTLSGTKPVIMPTLNMVAVGKEVVKQLKI